MSYIISDKMLTSLKKKSRQPFFSSKPAWAILSTEICNFCSGVVHHCRSFSSANFADAHNSFMVNIKTPVNADNITDITIASNIAIVIKVATLR